MNINDQWIIQLNSLYLKDPCGPVTTVDPQEAYGFDDHSIALESLQEFMYLAVSSENKILRTIRRHQA